MTDVQSGYADVNGATLYYETAGAGQPLLFVHAGIADSRMWDDQFEAFANDHRVVRFDIRGFGRSSAPAGPASSLADIAGLLDALGVERAALVGCSMGGSMALDFALAHPERTAALVLVGSGVSGAEHVDDDDPIWERQEAAYKSHDFDLTNELEMQVWVDGVGRTPDQVDPAVRAKVSMMNRALYDHDAEMNAIEWQGAEPPAYPRLESVSVPTLVILGDHDRPVVAQDAKALAERIPGARFVLMENTAHVPSMEKPEEFNTLLRDFLASASA